MTPLVQIENLTVTFPLGRRLLGTPPTLQAVKDVTLDIPKGSFVGLVGESGSGKTTLGRAILQAAPISDGRITYNDGSNRFDIGAMSRAEQRAFRAEAQLIFQDPYAALSPRLTVRDIIAEPLEILGLTRTRTETDERVRDIASKCRINLEHLRRYPHAFSGGQRQRISIARALVADECVAALDMSIQADILNLLKRLQRDMDLTFLFISHDLSVVGHVCDDLAVMYLGEIVEEGPTREVFSNPRHPYTRTLLAAIPSLDPDQRSRVMQFNAEA